MLKEKEETPGLESLPTDPETSPSVVLEPSHPSNHSTLEPSGDDLIIEAQRIEAKVMSLHLDALNQFLAISRRLGQVREALRVIVQLRQEVVCAEEDE